MPSWFPSNDVRTFAVIQPLRISQTFQDFLTLQIMTSFMNNTWRVSLKLPFIHTSWKLSKKLRQTKSFVKQTAKIKFFRFYMKFKFEIPSTFIKIQPLCSSWPAPHQIKSKSSQIFPHPLFSVQRSSIDSERDFSGEFLSMNKQRSAMKNCYAKEAVDHKISSHGESARNENNIFTSLMII